YELWRSESEGWVSVGKGPRLLARFQVDDKAMRNLNLVALTDAGIPGKDLAALFSLTPEHLSRLRTRVTEQGSAGLLGGVVGRPRDLSTDGDEMVYRLFDEGNTQTEIAAKLNVSSPGARSSYYTHQPQTEIAAKLNVSRFSVFRALKRRPSFEPTELPLEEAGAAEESPLVGGETPVGDEEAADGVSCSIFGSLMGI
ncbi:MAG: hypothetical protein ACYDEY_12010, partial [Acidimicrobiales bacterium]